MANNHCEDLGIPEHLHRNDRPVKPHFDDGEKIYRRLAPEHLEADGSLVLVTQRRLPLAALMASTFGTVEVLLDAGPHRVWFGKK